MEQHVSVTKSHRGQTAFLSGLSAEKVAEREYIRRGYQILARRWRGRGGEIDLIVRTGTCVVFIEVKKSKSFAAAAERLSRRQMQRITGAAAEFLSTEPNGQDTEVRFDAALVDSHSRIRILENAFDLE